MQSIPILVVKLVFMLKRIPIKYIRDYIKKEYKYDTCCYICGSKDKLELHHVYSISELFQRWCKENKIDKIEDVAYIKEIRIKFKEDYDEYLSSKNLFTLCNFHHALLHNLYGQVYPISFDKKIINWINIQKEKHNGN